MRYNVEFTWSNWQYPLWLRPRWNVQVDKGPGVDLTVRWLVGSLKVQAWGFGPLRELRQWREARRERREEREARGPRFARQPGCCTFLGRFDADDVGPVDLWFCSQGGRLPTVVARHGDGDEEYLSGIVGDSDWQMRGRALARGLGLLEDQGRYGGECG